MIPIREIKEVARLFGVPPSTIERDYAQNWLLSSFGSLQMALKGGTGIRKVYIEHYQFSDDLDFFVTLLEMISSNVTPVTQNLSPSMGFLLVSPSNPNNSSHERFCFRVQMPLPP